MGVKIGSKYVSGKYYIDDLSLMTGKIEDLQKALDIIEQFCFSFGFKVNIKKTWCQFSAPVFLACFRVSWSRPVGRALHGVVA